MRFRPQHGNQYGTKYWPLVQSFEFWKKNSFFSRLQLVNHKSIHHNVSPKVFRKSNLQGNHDKEKDIPTLQLQSLELAARKCYFHWGSCEIWMLCWVKVYKKSKKKLPLKRQITPARGNWNPFHMLRTLYQTNRK